MKKHHSQAMLVAILMITAAALAIGVAVAAISSSEVIQTVAARQSVQAGKMAQTCVEDKLMKMARADYSTGSYEFTNDLGSCTIEVSGGPQGAATFQLRSRGVVGKANRFLNVIVSVNIPQSEATDERVTIEKWEEVY